MGRLELLFLTGALLSALSCGAEGTPDSGGDQTVDMTVEDRAGFGVKGMVLAEGKPLAGVVVSDGINVTQTDFDGKYWLRSTADEATVWVSVPSGYEVPVEGDWSPRFWYPLDKGKTEAGEVQRFDFALRAVPQEKFSLCVFADTHIRGRNSLGSVSCEMDSVQFRKYFVPKVQGWHEENAGVPHYGIVLGDMIQDYATVQYKTGLPEYKKCLRDLRFPIFHIPGNHDYRHEDLTGRAWEDEEARGAKQYYIDHLGPTYYSFNIGKVHFVMLDGTRIHGTAGSSATENRVTSAQLSWLRKDLTHVSKEMHLVICCHQPLYTYSSTDNVAAGCIENRDELISLCDGFRRISILSGHIHYGDIANLEHSGVRIDQYTHPAVCGPFWLAHVNYDGSPNGFTSYVFSGTEFTRRQCSLDDAYDYRAILYTDYEDAQGNRKLVINVPAFEKGWTLTVLEDGKEVAQPVRTRMKDPGYEAMYVSRSFPSNTYTRTNSHTWLYTPVRPAALFKMIVTTSGGESFSLEGRMDQK